RRPYRFPSFFASISAGSRVPLVLYLLWTRLEKLHERGIAKIGDCCGGCGGNFFFANFFLLFFLVVRGCLVWILFPSVFRGISRGPQAHRACLYYDRCSGSYRIGAVLLTVGSSRIKPRFRTASNRVTRAGCFGTAVDPRADTRGCDWCDYIPWPAFRNQTR